MQSMEGLHCCNTCGKTFYSIDKLKRHERIHTGEKPYVCNICGKKFSRGEHLKQHERIHTGEKPHVGKTCEKSFSQLAYLKEHEKVHSGEKPYVCKTCNKAFSQLGSLRTHEIIHIGKKPYVCNVCGKGFSRRDYVRKHYRIHREQKLQCVTQKRISKKSSSKDCCLKYLKNIDVGQKSVAMIWNKQEKKSRFAVKPFGCRVCDELFVEENHFLTHCSLHFGDSDISQDSIFHSDCHGIVSKENLKEGFAIKELSNELAIESNADEIRGNSLRWFGHTEMIN